MTRERIGLRRLLPALMVFVLFMTTLLQTPRTVRAVEPEWAAMASLFIPGVGQMMNEDYVTGGAHFLITMGLYNQYFKRADDPRYIKYEDRYDEVNNVILTNSTTFEADLFAYTAQNLSFYSAYGAYRDGRAAIGNKGYKTPVPPDSLMDLAIAPFNPAHLSRPTTILPLMIPLLVAASSASSTQLVYQPDDTITRNEMRYGFAFMMEGVAIGEEAFFRGFLNNSFSSSLGETWGLVLSSVIFGLAHGGDPGQATSLSATLFGGYIGYLQQKNDYSIAQGVAIHFWWNFLASLSMLKERNQNVEVQLFTYGMVF